MRNRIAAWLAIPVLVLCFSACTGGDSSESTLRDSETITNATVAEAETPSASVSSETETDQATGATTAAPNPADGFDWGPFV